MKTIRNILLSVCLTIFIISFNNCNEEDPTVPVTDPIPTTKEINSGFLVNKSNGWSLKSITVPTISATTEEQWVDFKLTVSSGTMPTSDQATGANAVWPTGAWEMSENGKSIKRNDQVVMTVLKLTETEFSVSFTVPDGTEINSRTASLDGDYTFDLE